MWDFSLIYGLKECQSGSYEIHLVLEQNPSLCFVLFMLTSFHIIKYFENLKFEVFYC